MSVNDKMAAIADAIRNKTGKAELLTLDDMAAGIPEVYDKGYSLGEAGGYASGFNDGRGQEWSAFWDAYQYNGSYTPIRQFGNECWVSSIFYPKYDIKLRNSSFASSQLGNLKQRLEECGVKLIYEGGSITNCFIWSGITVIPDISGTPVTATEGLFANCGSLVTVEGVSVSESTGFSEWFTGCSRLESITFYGVIANDISFPVSPLSADSMKNVITCLKDYAGTTEANTHRVTFTDACKEVLAAEGATSPNNNTWAEYAADKGWLI